MAILKCKMCGGDLNITEGVTVVECDYCGTKQTVPSADNEKKLTLFARANKLRAACEFDKAAGVYEALVSEFSEEAEAYWGLVLCKYGIEYVDDPATGKKIPTCHRSSFESVLDDSNFDLVMENADALSLSVYREEAKQIEELRKGIIEVSSKEEPYDIFICYKETSENGDRTVDSVIAQDVYDEITAKGYRVFFSRITLEDKLGQEYEPYIFAALNSAKIMLAFGTCYEHYNAVWVKNEWSRFLQLIANGEKKHIIPCYKGIDAYDMPKEFAKLQAQDMGKVGATQDLLRGIEKILPKNAEPEKVFVQSAAPQSATTETLLKRAFMYLEDGNWQSADEYCEKVLDIDPENARAYLGKLMVELQVRHKNSLKDCAKPFDDRLNFKKYTRFCDDAARKEMSEFNENIRVRNDYNAADRLYNQAMERKALFMTSVKNGLEAPSFQSVSSIRKNYSSVISAFNKVPDTHRDTVAQNAECITAYKDVIYKAAVSWVNKSEANNDIKYQYKQVEEATQNAIIAFEELGDYEESNAFLEKARALNTDAMYYRACHTSNTTTLDSISIFERLGDYKNSKENAQKCREISNLFSQRANLYNQNKKSDGEIANAKDKLGNSPEYAHDAVRALITFGIFVGITLFFFLLGVITEAAIFATLGGMSIIATFIYIIVARANVLDRRVFWSIVLSVIGISPIIFIIEMIWEYFFWNAGLGKYKRSINRNKTSIAQNNTTIAEIDNRIAEIYQSIMQQ